MTKKIYDFSILKLKKEIIDCEKTSMLDPILLSEFANVIRKINIEDWKKIKENFFRQIEFTYDTEEKMCFTILALTLKDDFLNKDINLTSELCTMLIVQRKNPLNYVNYAQIILSDPLYSLIIKARKKSKIFGYIEILCIIFSFDIIGICEADYNNILKHISYIFQEEYITLIPTDATFNDIYNILYSHMIEQNKTHFMYKPKDFQTLKLLKFFEYMEDSEEKTNLRKQIQEIEKAYLTKNEIVREIIKLIRINKALTIVNVQSRKRVINK